MNKFQHSSCNDVLAAPPGFAIDECAALPVLRHRAEDGTHLVSSFWRPNPGELESLVRGNGACVTVMGLTHAPLRVDVANCE